MLKRKFVLTHFDHEAHAGNSHMTVLSVLHTRFVFIVYRQYIKCWSYMNIFSVCKLKISLGN